MTQHNTGLAVIGAQWGDEGKGKIVDLLAAQSGAVVRFQGGHNAGHTIVTQQGTVVLHLVPSGIHHGITCCIGNGAVVAPHHLLQELDRLAAGGLDVWGKVRLSPLCPVVLPSHEQLDRAREEARGALAIGTTGRGIGPAYEDKAARRGLHVAHMLDSAQCQERLDDVMDLHNFLLQSYFGKPALSIAQVHDELLAAGERLRPLVADIPLLLEETFSQGKTVLFEGAQGVLLDIDHGTYPFVTSSNTVAGFASVGTGVAPARIQRVLGVIKAYTTRVGAGPFPTEITGAAHDYLATRGHEFGATTGRPRRCGWLDIVALRRAIVTSGITELAITKLDILDGLENIPLVVAYTLDGQRIETMPQDAGTLLRCQPILEELPGWQDNTARAVRLQQLPQAAFTYLRRIEELAGIPITLLSTGPARDDVIFTPGGLHP
jgi:adenylosuccinate synthase